jgi:dihydroflavonol-4-reductase
VVVVNPSTPVGPGDLKPTPTGKIIVDFLRGKIPAYVDTGLNLIAVEDVAQAHLLAAEKGRIGEKYILGNRNLTLREILAMLAAITDSRPPSVRIPHWIALAAAAVDTGLSHIRGVEPGIPLEAALMSRKRMFFSADKAIGELGLRCSSVEDALARAVEWFCRKGVT